ncbi:MAG: virulence protein RhuM/Fic/DOC family protein [Proteobacteria bacterium]|nr:virulence protein RhuM/Fic/DOC family protein [Pseudomonadota bacterium]
MTDKSRGEILFYKTEDGSAKLEVRLEQETIWLDAHQMGVLFERDRSVIVKHIRNIYKNEELSPDSTCAKNAQVAADNKTRIMDLYNLDMIISVGYRVNSRRGTQFRIWATQVLKDHIIKGYTINEKRLKEQNERLRELQQTIDLLGRIVEERQLAGQEAEGLLKVVSDYSLALRLLDDYDYSRLAIGDTTEQTCFIITYEAARKAVDRLATTSGINGSHLFGREKDESFQSSIGAIYQTFEGKEVYPSIEEKAAHLLYFVVKNHSFVDGNKRIAASLFLWFLDANGILYRQDGSKRIGDNALVALTLMIAESRPEEKDVMIRVIVNLINKNN